MPVQYNFVRLSAKPHSDLLSSKFLEDYVVFRFYLGGREPFEVRKLFGNSDYSVIGFLVHFYSLGQLVFVSLTKE